MKVRISIICLFLTLALFVDPTMSSETKWVTVDGFASLENVTKVEARKMAIDDARRVAIEKVVGVEILSETMVINSEIAGDVVCSIPYGKVVEQEILKENVILSPQTNKGGAPFLTYKVNMKVLVAKEQGKADPYYRVKATINRTVFKEGDHIELRITPTKDAYITVFNILEDQTVLILIPNRFKKDNFVKANNTLIFPNEEDRKKGISLEAFVGDGKVNTNEMFHIVALKEPINFDSAKFNESIFDSYDGSSGMVSDLVKETVRIPLSQRAELFIHYRIEI
jgi:hypothetical protein